MHTTRVSVTNLGHNDLNHILICNSHIDMLSCKIEDVAKNIARQTGWACTIIVGGPMPQEGGAIQTLV